MGIPAAISPLLLGQSRYLVPRSLRVRNGNYLNRTFATGTGSTTHWVSVWVKRTTLGGGGAIVLGAADATTRYDLIYFGGNDNLAISHATSATVFGELVTNAVYRDTSAWMHIYYVHDSRDATAANRMRLWINGVEVSSWLQRTNIASQNSTLASWLTNTADPHEIGRNPRGGVAPFDGYMAELVCGQGGNPPPVGTFGRFDPATGAWVPRKIGSGTSIFGTSGNGFYLPFTNFSTVNALGNDASGNGRNWTGNGFGITTNNVGFDCVTDTPTENFAVLSAVQPATTPVVGGLAMSTATADWRTSASTWLLNRGKQFFEVEAGTIAVSPASYIAFGVARSTTNNFVAGYYAGSAQNGFGLVVSPTNVMPYNDAVAFTAAQITGTFSIGNWFRCAIDYDAGKIWLGTATQWCNGGDPDAGTNPTYTFTPGFSHIPVLSTYNSYAYINFGQQPWKTTKPSTFNGISSLRLPTPVISRGDSRFGILTYTGDDVTPKTRSGLRFQPDLVWIKARNDALNHTIWDSVRGAGAAKGLSSNTADPEGLGTFGGSTANNGYVSSFNSDGFTTTTGGVSDLYVNDTGKTYIAWAWDRDPLVTGVDIVTYTGNGTAGRTIAHGLGVAPEMIIVKALSGSVNWLVYHFGANATPQNGYVNLNNDIAFTSDTIIWNNTAPSSSAFTVGTGLNVNGVVFVAYVFRSVPGFSSFGWFQGNGSTNGPYIPLSFRPRYCLFKMTSAVANWFIRDTARSPFNTMDQSLLPNLTAVEAAGVAVDFYSNGIKPRSSGSGLNGTNENIIYAAFAETPFKYANAR